MSSLVIAGVDFAPILDTVAARLAHMDDRTQAQFFNIFAKELSMECATNFQAGAQAAYIAMRATKEFKDFCSQICYKDET